MPTYSHSFVFTPPARFGSGIGSWEQVRVEESSNDAIFTTVETLDLDGVQVEPSGFDPDPSEPLERSITTDAATLATGYFRVVWVDGDSDESPPSGSVFSPSEGADFLTVEELGDYLGRDLSGDDGAAAVVAMACETCRTLSEQDFASVSNDAITLDGTGTDTLLLPQVPVSAVGTVTVNETTLDAGEFTFTERGHLIRTGGTANYSSWAQGSGPLSYWPQGRQNVAVTYSHGGAVPEDVRMVALMLASRLAVQGVEIQKQIGQQNSRYANAASDLTANEKRILRKHKVSR